VRNKNYGSDFVARRGCAWDSFRKSGKQKTQGKKRKCEVNVRKIKRVSIGGSLFRRRCR
jgi:hypothetical protein